MISFVRNEEEIDVHAVRDDLHSITTVPWQDYNPNSLKAGLGYFSPTPRSFVDTYSSEMAGRINVTLAKAKPDLIIASQIVTARYLTNLLNVPKILEEAEVGHLYPSGSIRQKMTWKKNINFTARIIRQFSTCTVVSEIEKGYLQKFVRSCPSIEVIPNGVDCRAYQPSQIAPEANTLIYNGSLTYRANFDAVAYFLNEIFPIIRRNIPDIRFFITGSTKNVDLAGFQQIPGVQFTGFLFDIQAAVSSASVCVVPLREGGGTRLKILEAMASGTPVVSTSKGAEGIKATDGENILLADNPKDFATQVERLIRAPDLRRQITRQARDFVENFYCWESITPKFLSLVDQQVLNSIGIPDRTQPR